MKTCITCNKEKSDTDFKEKSQKCFDCYKEYQLNYRIKNSNKMKIYNQNYYKENKEDIIQSVQSYYSENRDKVAQYKKDYWENNKEKLSKKIRTTIKIIKIF